MGGLGIQPLFGNPMEREWATANGVAKTSPLGMVHSHRAGNNVSRRIGDRMGSSQIGGSGVDPSEFTRRAALKRGAVVGGSLLWVTPIMQTLAISPAFAQATSPGGDPPPTTSPPGTTPTTQPGGGGTTTTSTPGGGGTTSTTQPGGGGGTTTTTPPTTIPAQVQGVEFNRPTGGSVDPGGQTALPQALGAEQARPATRPARALPSVAERVAATGANLGDLAALGGASTVVGSALAWSSRRHSTNGANSADQADPVAAADPAADADEAL